MRKEFATSPAYWDFTGGAPAGTEHRINEAFVSNLVTMEEIEGKTFDLVRFLFASICFHYDTLDTYLYHEHKM